MVLNNLSIAKEIKEKITAPIPEYLIQQRDGGGNKKLSYISGSTVVDMLNNAFGYTWSWETKKEWIEESQPFFNTYAKAGQGVELTWHNGKQGAWTPQGPVAHVLGILTVYMTTENGIIEVKKEGYGSKSILGKQNDQESIFKSAGTDALKKAASLLGIGLELYRNEDEQAYFDMINYDDPWTAEMQTQYAKELENLSKYTETYSVSDEELQEIVYAATGNEYSVLPTNIEIVLDYIQESLKGEQ